MDTRLAYKALIRALLNHEGLHSVEAYIRDSVDIHGRMIGKGDTYPMDHVAEGIVRAVLHDDGPEETG